MPDYLREGWPLGPTSTLYADGTALFDVRRYGKAGIRATVHMTDEEAQVIRDVVREHVQDTESQVVESLVREWDDGGRLDAAVHGLDFEGWVRRRADSVQIGVADNE